MEPKSSGHLRPRRGPRALRHALLVALAAAALCWLAPRPAAARRQPKSCTVTFVFEVDPGGRIDQRGRAVELEVRNVLDESEPARRLSVKFGQMWEDGPHPAAEVVQGEGAFTLVAGTVALIYPRTKDGGQEAKRGDRAVYLVVDDVSWPGAEAARVSAAPAGAGGATCAVSLPLPPSRYAVTADIKSDSAGGEPERVLDLSKELSAGRRYVMPVKASTTFERLFERYGNRESLLVSIILGLVGFVAAVLKDKLKEAANHVLDGLGRLGSGRLAERRFRRKYLTVMAGRHKHLRLVGFSSTGVSRPLLEEVFVSLRISTHGQPALGGDGHGATAAAPSIPFAAALAQHPKMVILGAPGAGKTTTLSYALLTFAAGRQRERFGIARQLLPVFVPLRRLSGGGRSVVEDLTDPATQLLPNDLLKDLPKRYFEKMLERGECVVLLDGLDEVVDEKSYREVADKINDLASAYPDNRFVVTCRSAGWRSYLSGDFAVLRTQDFSRDEIQRFVLGWHRAVITQSEYGRLFLDRPDRKEFERDWARHYEEKVKPAIEIKSRNLLNQIDTNNRILAIAVNPMLLSLTCLVHSVRNILPRGRTILYSQCLEQLIDSWDRSRDIAWHQPGRTTPNQKEAVLREIAFDFQARGKGEDTRGNIEALVADISKRLGISVPAAELLEEIELRSGLLIERSIGVFGFSHLTLQEYLVAKHVLLNARYVPLLHENVEKQEWREVLLLYAGLLDDATALVKQILEKGAAGGLALAGLCIGDSQHCDPAVAERVIEGLLARLHEGAAGEDEVAALAALAVDFEGEPKTPREELAASLTAVADGFPFNPYDPTPDPRLRADCVTILGRAKAAAALDTITELLFDRNAEIQDAAARALVSFGNLALDHLSQALDQLQALMPTVGEDDSRELDQVLLKVNRSVSEEVLYLARTVEAYVNVLMRINTGGAARLLLKLYEPMPSVVGFRASLALARMLNNPFIEADLQQLKREALPWAVRMVEEDDDIMWPYKNLPPGSGFPRLAGRIVTDLYVTLLNPSKWAAPAAERDGAQAIPLKLMFPALLKLIKHEGAARSLDSELFDEVWVRLGYGEQADFSRLNLLAAQIRNSYSTSLSAALQNTGAAETGPSAAPRKALVRATVWLSNFSFAAYMAYCIYWLFIFCFFLYERWHDLLTVNRRNALIAVTVALLSYLSVVVVTQLKLRRRFFSLSTLGTLAFPVSNLLKVFRNSVTTKRWEKFIGLQVPLHLLNVLVIDLASVLLSEMMVIINSRVIALFILPQAGLFLFSFLYLKFYLLASNPTLQLLLAHPEGAKLVRSS